MIFRKKTGDFKGVKAEEAKFAAKSPDPLILQDNLGDKSYL